MALPTISRMTSRRVPGVLSLTALRALATLRPVDRLDQLREARAMSAQGASIADICDGLGLTSAEVRALMGTKRQ